MTGGGKCKTCGSSDVEVDPSRGDTVCTNCGTVLEDNAIVSEMQFEENAHGGATAIGQFVSSESSGGCRGFGNGFHSGAVKESREITLQNARRGLSNLCQQLRLNQHCLETSFNFYKMALARHLTTGRKHAHVLAACLYITCRLEGTPHLLIDLSDVIQICAFELGRTYVKLSQALCINIPSVGFCYTVITSNQKSETEYLSDELSDRETSDSSSICTDDCTEFIDEIKEPILPNDNFVWHDMGTYNSHREIFDEDDRPQKEAKKKTEPIDILKLFFPIEFVETIVEQTNRYTQQKRASLGMVFPCRSRMNEWTNVRAEEIYVVFEFYMQM